MPKTIYLDHAATTYLDPKVTEAMQPFFENIYGNPGAILYTKGRAAKQAVDQARQTIADILNCLPEEIIFEGSGTESDNHALIGAALANQGLGRQIITSAIEHHAVLHACQHLETQGFEVIYLPVDKKGLVELDQLADSVKPETILVSIMYANNEIGTIQPIKKIVKLVKAKNPKTLVHTDACQTAACLNLNVQELGVDLMTINGSKIYGPKGTGLLYVKKGVAIRPIIHGGAQEFGKRAGTENVAGLVGLAKALEIVQANKDKENQRLVKLRDKLINGLLKIPKTFLNGDRQHRLPNNVNVTLADVEGEAMLLHLDQAGICASTGSACTSESLDPSHVILALGQPYEVAHGSLRFSLGHCNTLADIEQVLEILPKIVKKLRQMSPVNLDIDKLKN